MREKIARLESSARAEGVTEEAFWHLAKGDAPFAEGEIDAGSVRLTYQLFGIDRARGGVVIIREFLDGKVFTARAITFDDLHARFGPDGGSREAWWYQTRELLARFATMRRESWRKVS